MLRLDLADRYDPKSSLWTATSGGVNRFPVRISFRPWSVVYEKFMIPIAAALRLTQKSGGKSFFLHLVC
jgi:hypothetical protein